MASYEVVEDNPVAVQVFATGDSIFRRRWLESTVAVFIN